MRKTLILLIVLSFIFACKKKEKVGTVNYSLSYSRSTTDLKNLQTIFSKDIGDTLYTQFGDYITSLTPTIFNAKFLSIDYHNDKPIGTNGDVENGGYMLSVINGNLPESAPERFADFTNNNTLNVTPQLFGDLDNETVFSANEIHFTYLLAQIQYIYQEVELPYQYDSITLSQFIGTNAEITGNILKAQDNLFANGIFNSLGIPGMIRFIIFGNTDSTYASATEGNNQIWGMQGGAALRSSNYTELVFYKPEEGEVFTINTNLSFNYNNLIQIYAGADNIPYTSDDVFVYRPKFWNRLHVTATTN